MEPEERCLFDDSGEHDMIFAGYYGSDGELWICSNGDCPYEEECL